MLGIFHCQDGFDYQPTQKKTADVKQKDPGGIEVVPYHNQTQCKQAGRKKQKNRERTGSAGFASPGFIPGKQADADNITAEAQLTNHHRIHDFGPTGRACDQP